MNDGLLAAILAALEEEDQNAKPKRRKIVQDKPLYLVPSGRTPAFVSAEIGNVDAFTVVVTFDQTLSSAPSLTIFANAVEQAIDSSSFVGTTASYILTGTYSSTDVFTLIYLSAEYAITNNIPAADPIGDALRAAAVLSVKYSSGNFIDPARSHIWTNHGGVTSATLSYGDIAILNGTNQWISTPSDTPDLSPNSTDFTIITALYLNSLPPLNGSGNVFPFVKDNSNGDDEYYLTVAGINPDYKFQFVVNGNGAFQNVDSSVAPQTGQWFLIYCWYDSSVPSINIQIDNGSIDSVSPNELILWDGTMPIIAAPTTFDLGVDSGAGGTPFSYMDGKVIVTIVSRLLTTDEKTYLYNSGDGRALYP